MHVQVASVCCVRTSGRHLGRRSLFSVWFHLVHQETQVSDGLPLEYSWPGARSYSCDLLVFLPPYLHSSILCIVSPHLRSPRHRLSLPGVSLIPTETQKNTEPEFLHHPHNCTYIQGVNDSYPMHGLHIVFCPLLNI